MDRILSVGNKSNDILFLIGFIVVLYIALLFNQYLQQWYAVYAAKPYCSKELSSEPVQKGLITWMMHGYVPDHNAGSEWMAHAINTFWIREHGGRVNVITQKPSVTVYDRVSIFDDKDIPSANSMLQRSHVLLTHHNMTPRAVQTALETKKPLIIVLHDHWQYKQAREAKRWLGDNLYCITNSEWIEKYYSPLNISSCVCYPPVYWRDYAVETNRTYVTLINVNRNKGGDVLINIAKEMPDVKFLGVQGAYSKQVYGQTPNLTYMKTTPEIKTIYAQTSILLMPSKEESWGRTAIEAMSSGIPVIAHPTPGLVESCGKAGIFCDRYDTGAWVREIRKLLNDENYYQECSLACKRRAMELEPEGQLHQLCRWIDGLEWKEGGSPGVRKYPLFG